MNYIIFQVHNTKFAIDINYVNEMINIVYLEDINHNFIDCLINYHGKLIPVIEASKIFNFLHGDYSLDSIIIIVSIKDTILGILTDSIFENISEEEIPKEKIEKNNDLFVLNTFKVKEDLVYLIDIEKVAQKVFYENKGILS